MNNGDTKTGIIGKVLSLCIVFILLSQVVNAQIAMVEPAQLQPKQPLISVNFQQKPLPKALRAIAEKVDVGLSYKTTAVPSKPITYQAKNVPVYNVFDAVLKDTDLYYELSENQKVILIKQLHLQAVNQVQQTVTGTVTNAQSGEPISDVNIVVRNTNLGTSTGADGHYSLQVPSLQDTLVFSFIGYESKVVPIRGRTEINVQLQPSAIVAEELVVVGYGKQKEGTLTTAVTSVSSEEVNVTPVAGVQKALQGKVSGLRIRRSGGPGTEPIVQIRGISSISYSTSPLIVIDGMPTGNLTSIDNHDIASVQVLKGASAAAIYGSRATNGVILVTTKKGAYNSELQVDFSSSIGFKTVYNNIDLLNTQQYLSYIDRFLGVSKPPRVQDHFNDPIYEGASRTYAETSTDWQDAYFKRGIIANTHLSLNGGGENTRYYVSGGYFRNEGIALGQKFDRYNFRVNSQHEISDVFSVGENLYVTHTSQVSNGETGNRTHLVSVIRSIPYLPAYDPTTPLGYRSAANAKDGANPTSPVIGALLLDDSHNDFTKVLGTVYLNVDFTPWLRFKSTFGIDYTRFYQHQFDPIYSSKGRGSTIATITNNRTNSTVKLFTEQLTFDHTFGDKHHLVVQAIYEQQINDVYNISATGNQQTNNIETLAGATNITAQTSKAEAILMSYIFRLNYQYAGKYLLSAAIRRDGLSIWAPGNKFANFPSISVGWRIDKEGFMQNQSLISKLKVRAGYGVTGLNGFLLDSFYPWQVVMQVHNTTYPFNNTNKKGNGSYYNQIGNPNLGWEKTKELNIGLELGLLNNRITLVADYYRRSTDNLLLQVPTPPSLGYYQSVGTVAGVLANVAEMQNNGLDLKLTYRNSGDDFSWNVSGLVSIVRNQVVNLNTPNGTIGAGGDQDFGGGAPITLTKSGHPIQSFYGYVVDGIFQNWNEVYNAPYQKQAIVNNPGETIGRKDYVTSSREKLEHTAPGDIRFKDLNGDGVIDPEDRTFIGSYIPDFSYSLNFNANYRNFHFSLLLSGTQGNEIFNAAKIIRSGMVRLFGADTDVLNSWTPDNKDTNIPRAVSGDPNGNARVSTRWVEDGSYLRVKHLRIGYSIPASALQAFTHGSLSNLTIYLTSQNLFTFTSYSGWDPEIGSKNTTLTNGIDYGAYPAPRSFIFGFELSF